MSSVSASLAGAVEQTKSPPVLATVIGNAAEFYDFVVYSYFAVYIGDAFFPSSTAYLSLLLSVATFGAGFLTRPLGAAVIGRYADRRGRGPAMMLSIVLMGAGSGLIGIVPDFATIGIAAPLIVLVARLVQGFAVGGEVGPATSFMYESAQPGRRGFAASLQGGSQGVANLAGGLIGVALSQVLGAGDLARWGWRVPFLIGLLVIPIGIQLRRGLVEPAASDGTAAPRSMLGDLARHRVAFAFCVASIMAATVGLYVQLFMTSFALKTLHMGPLWAMMATAAGGLTLAIASVAGGILGDRFGALRVMLVTRALYVIAVWPCYAALIADPGPATLLVTVVATGTLNSLCMGAGFALFAGCFPRSVRSMCLSLAYALSVTIFGGFTQTVVTSLLAMTNDAMSPAYVLIVSGSLSLAGMAWLGRKLPRLS